MNLEEKTLYELSTPIKLTNFMLKKPFCMLSIGYFILIVIGAICYQNGWQAYDQAADRDFMVWGHPDVINWDKSNLVK